ncbi:unnamed protein product [Hydatigera taeniaeformis]|uniref:SLC3A2_N domain-containing protein n=1 Tax=Hydatigena taeniaeformis TaxID=6205 RepID=A0A0R3X510_HYDTA|nr:unnamed protein product [Hydatigera taeniaeformis]
MRLELVITHNAYDSMSKQRLIRRVTGNPRSLLPANGRSACSLAHTHARMHAGAEARRSHALPRERIASSTLRPPQGNDDKEEKRSRRRRRKASNKDLYPRTLKEAGESEERWTSKCREAGMQASGEDVVSESVPQGVPFAGLSVGLLHSLQWVRRIEALVGQKRLLLGVSWSAGSLALLLLFCAIAMDSWLFTVEREPDETSNATFLITLHSGLWRVCKKNLFMKDVGKNTQWNLSWREFSPRAFYLTTGEPVDPLKLTQLLATASTLARQADCQLLDGCDPSQMRRAFDMGT